MWETARGSIWASASLVLLEGKKEQLNDFNSLIATSVSGNVQRSRKEGSTGRQKALLLALTGKSPCTFGNLFPSLFPGVFCLSLRFRCVLTHRAKDTSNTRFVPCISCPTNIISANLHSDLVRERLGCIPSVRNLRPRESRQLFFMGKKPAEEFQFVSILVPCLDDLLKGRSSVLSSMCETMRF